jgi:hypothetical protein
MPWKRRDPTPPPDVNVNDRLARLRTEDLYDQAEACIMMAGYHLSEWRNSAFRPIDIDNALTQAEWAVEALRALRSR